MTSPKESTIALSLGTSHNSLHANQALKQVYMYLDDFMSKLHLSGISWTCLPLLLTARAQGSCPWPTPMELVNP